MNQPNTPENQLSYDQLVDETAKNLEVFLLKTDELKKILETTPVDYISLILAKYEIEQLFRHYLLPAQREQVMQIFSGLFNTADAKIFRFLHQSRYDY